MKLNTLEKVKMSIAQLCPTLCDPDPDRMDGSLPGSSVRGVFQARM